MADPNEDEFALTSLKELKYSVCPVPKSTFTTFMDEGRMHFKAGKFRKALFCFDRALLLQPTSKAALVSRSQCHLKLGDADAALRDAQTSFDSDDTFIQGLYQYAEALFNLGQFEQAAISYHRGFRARHGEEFRIGINKCQCAIRRAIGDPQATQIEDLNQIIFKIDEIQNAKGDEGHCCVLDRDSEIELRLRGNKKKGLSKNRARWVDREVLGVLQHDKIYLEKFLKRPDIAGNHQSGSEGLRDAANDALKYLEIRENFWRQQNPMYARKVGLNFNNDIVIQYEKMEQERMEASRRIKMDAAQGAVLKNLTQIEHALKIGRAQDCQLECDRALRQIKEINIRLLPKKPHFMTEILHFKGLALLKLKNFDGAVSAFQEELNVATQYKMTETKSRALDYLGRSYAMKGSFAEAAEIWDTRLAIAKTPVERAYLYHEIGRCYYEMHKLELSKIYGNQSLDEALKINDWIWAMNATILLGQCETRMKNFDKALEQFEQAANYAVKCGNKGNLALLQECEHCLKIYLEKQEPEVEVKPTGADDAGDHDSDDSLTEKADV